MRTLISILTPNRFFLSAVFLNLPQCIGASISPFTASDVVGVYSSSSGIRCPQLHVSTMCPVGRNFFYPFFCFALLHSPNSAYVLPGNSFSLNHTCVFRLYQFVLPHPFTLSFCPSSLYTCLSASSVPPRDPFSTLFRPAALILGPALLYTPFCSHGWSLSHPPTMPSLRLCRMPMPFLTLGHLSCDPLHHLFQHRLLVTSRTVSCFLPQTDLFPFRICI